MPYKTRKIGAYRLTQTGLKVSGKPTLEEAEVVGDELREQESHSAWFVGDWYNDLRARFEDTWPQAVASTGYAETTCEQYGWVCQAFPHEEREFISEVSFGHHTAVADLGKRDRRRLLNKCQEEGLSISALRQLVRLLKRRTVMSGGVEDVELKGTFKVIYADPPWPYDDSGKLPGKAFTKAEQHYPTMKVVDIAAMPIEEHARKNAVLFLWIPAPLLFEAPEVIQGWGFTYKANIVWSKVAHNVGHYISNRHEHLLVATRGSCVPDRLTPMIESVQTIKRSMVHSAKPPQFRQLIERLYDGPYLELFARERVEGWTTHGNEFGAKVA